jgi:hypothetical protein
MGIENPEKEPAPRMLFGEFVSLSVITELQNA